MFSDVQVRLPISNVSVVTATGHLYGEVMIGQMNNEQRVRQFMHAPTRILWAATSIAALSAGHLQADSSS